MKKIRIITAGVVLAFGVLLGGCASTPEVEAKAEAVSDAAADESSPPAEPPASPPAEPEPTEPTPTDDGIAKIGATEWYDYEDGLRLQVTKVERFRIGSYAAGGTPGGSGVKVTVTIQNDTGATFDASLGDVLLQSGANGDEAESVYDSEQGLEGGFQGTIAAGRKKTAVYGFAVPEGHKIVLVEAAPSWDHQASHFEGTVK